MENRTLGQRVSDRWWPGDNEDDREVKRALAVVVDSEATKSNSQPDEETIKHLLIDELQTAHTEEYQEYSYHNGADALYERLLPYLRLNKRESSDGDLLYALEIALKHLAKLPLEEITAASVKDINFMERTLSKAKARYEQIEGDAS